MYFKTDLLHSWKLNHKVTIYLLDNVEQEWLGAKLSGKGRSIGEQFVHINNIRSFWIGKVHEKRDLRMDKKYANDRLKLEMALNESAQKMTEALDILFEQKSIKGYNPHPTAFFAQMVAHESHHRGQIMATITRNGFKINKSVNFGLWSWNNK